MSDDSIIASNYKMLWEEGELLDFTIKVEDSTFEVHKTIMASASCYFRAMLTAGMAESNKSTVTMKGDISAVAMDNLIRLIYTEQMDVNHMNVASILSGAVYLQITFAIEACTKYIMDNIDELNCFDLRSLFLKYSLIDKVKEVNSYMTKNSETILKHFNPEIISYEDFLSLCKDWHPSEGCLFKCISSWVAAELPERGQYLNDLLCNVRYCLMPPKQLQQIQKMKVYTESTGEWRSLVCRGLDYHMLPIHLKIIDESIQSTVRGEQKLSCLPSSLECVDPSIYTLDGKSWLRTDIGETPDFEGKVTSVVEINNFAVICADVEQTSVWYVFNPRTLEWLEMTRSPVYKTKFAAVTHNGKLYVIGGCTTNGVTDSVEVYDFRTNTWSETTKLLSPLMNHAACVYDNHIFISGGKESEGHPDSSRFECLDLTTKNTWESKGSMPMTCHNHSMSVMNCGGEDRIYVIGYDFYPECYTLADNEWSYGDFTFDHPPPSRLEEGSVLAKGNSFYILGGTSKHFVHMIKSLYMKLTMPVEGDEVCVEYLDTLCLDELEIFCVDPMCAFLTVPPHML